MNLLQTALQEYGVKEVPGGIDHNPRIVQYFYDIGHEWVTDDETAWCSAFVDWCCKEAGLIGSGKLNARSWLKVGEEVDQCLGDIVVFWRSSKTSWKGHVGIFIAQHGDKVYCLGGNQSNQVCISGYDVKRVLGYRRPHLKPAE